MEWLEKKNLNRILSLAGDGHLPDIMNFSNGNINGKKLFNNIIYYDENINNFKSINQDINLFERITPGAFIFCTSLESLELIKRDIVKQNKRNKRRTFNLITTGSKCEIIIEFINKNIDFKGCINKICVYCFNIEKWNYLKNKYEIVHNVVTNKKDVISFINEFSLEEIRPYSMTRLLTYKDYQEKYKESHFKISLFYGDLTVEQYNNDIKKMKSLIKTVQIDELKKRNRNSLLSKLLTFDLDKDVEALDRLITQEYTKNIFYGDLNKWLMNYNMDDYEPIAYLIARIMYNLNIYAIKYNIYFNENEKEFYRGVKMTYSDLLPYERAKGKIILLSGFTLASQNELLANKLAGRDNTQELYKINLKYSVVFIIKNYYNKDWISNGIDLQKELEYKNEKEILYQPFSFYYVRDVRIDNKNYMADIYLDTIGKTAILEEKIREGKEIEFNPKLRIMEVKQ